MILSQNIRYSLRKDLYSPVVYTCKLFRSGQANAFHQWLADTRTEMMETSGSLEQQLVIILLWLWLQSHSHFQEMLKRKAQDIRAQRVQLRKIEDLGALLEENLILDNRYTEHSTVGLAQAWDQGYQIIGGKADVF